MKLLENLLFALLVIVALNGDTFGIESSASFVITSFGSHYKVLGPSRLVGLKGITKTQVVGVTIQNKTLSTLKGKIVTNKGEVLTFTSVKAGENRSYDIKLKKNMKYYFYPLSPAFQKVELKIGKEAYEIPEKR